MHMTPLPRTRGKQVQHSAEFGEQDTPMHGTDTTLADQSDGHRS